MKLSSNALALDMKANSLERSDAGRAGQREVGTTEDEMVRYPLKYPMDLKFENSRYSGAHRKPAM